MQNIEYLFDFRTTLNKAHTFTFIKVHLMRNRPVSVSDINTLQDSLKFEKNKILFKFTESNVKK